MGPATSNLIEILGELITLLRHHGEERWSSWFESDLAHLQNDDFHGVTHHLAAYGGMGSFNDFFFVGGTENRAANELLFDLRSRAWNLADEIHRTVESEQV
jgi:hypothetical protein